MNIIPTVSNSVCRSTSWRAVMNYSSSGAVIPSLSVSLSHSNTHTHTHSHTHVWWAVQWTFLSAGFPSPSALSRHTLQSVDSNTLMSVSRLPSFCFLLHPDCSRPPICYQYSMCSCFVFFVFLPPHLIDVLMHNPTTVTMVGLPEECLWDLTLLSLVLSLQWFIWCLITSMWCNGRLEDRSCCYQETSGQHHIFIAKGWPVLSVDCSRGLC